jgi:glycosyltransferase involved in cell wall biosynthesis
LKGDGDGRFGMKITIMQGAFLPVPTIMGGAVEKIWYRLGQEFARTGHEVVHISRAHPELKDTEQIEGVRHLRVRGYDTPGSLLKLKLLDLFYSRRACGVVAQDSDVVVTNTFWSPLLLPENLRCKAFVDVQRMPKGQIRWYRQARLRANSTPVAAAIRQELPTREHHRVAMIPNPLPFVVNEPFDEISKQPILLYCGRVHPEKGLRLLIEALRWLDQPWPLRIVGPWQTEQGGGGADYKNELVVAARGLPVTFVGPLHGTEALNAEYRTAAVFIYPSIAERGETFGSAPLEAMAWGCAPIVSNLDCFKDFIQTGKNGVIFDHRSSDAVKNLAEAIRLLTSDTGRLGAMARQATDVRQSHSPQAISRLFLNDFNNIQKPGMRLQNISTL